VRTDAQTDRHAYRNTHSAPTRGGVIILTQVIRSHSGPDLLQAGSLFRKKMCGPLIYEYPITPSPAPDCLHPTLSGPTRTVVIIDISLRTRAAMHTTIAAAADWQFEASLSEANCKRVKEYWSNFCPFVGAPFLWGPMFGRTC